MSHDKELASLERAHKENLKLTDSNTLLCEQLEQAHKKNLALTTSLREQLERAHKGNLTLTASLCEQLGRAHKENVTLTDDNIASLCEQLERAHKENLTLTDDNIASLRKQLEQAHKENSALTTSLSKQLELAHKATDDNENKLALLHEQLERTHKENSTLTDEYNHIRKKCSSLLQEITSNNNEYARIESELYQQSQEVERLKKENVGFLKKQREVERKLREETQAFEKDRIVWHERESELMAQFKALQDTLSVLGQQNEQALKKNGQSDSNDDDSPPSSPTAASHYTAIREVKTAHRTIKDLERRVSELTTEIEGSKRAHTESMNLNKSHVAKIHHLENELGQIKDMNQTLKDENECFQHLLHGKTMKGEFMLNTGTVENESSKDDGVLIQDEASVNKLKSIAIDLAAELGRASDLSVSLQGERVHKESDHTIDEKLQMEIKCLRDSNKSLNLYIQKILNRILEAQGFEELLSAEWPAKRTTASTPVSPTSESFNVPEPKKKIERRKTVSGVFHLRSASQPQNSLRSSKDKITEEPENLIPETTGNKPANIPKRAQRRDSSSSGLRKRFSIAGWLGGGVKEEEKKDDVYLRPMILVQENEKE